MSEQPEKVHTNPRRRKPHYPPLYTKEQIRAVQAVMLYGIGSRDDPPSAHDCKVALDWIIEEAAGTYNETFVAGEPDASDYLAGRRSVGLALVKMFRLKPELFKE